MSKWNVWSLDNASGKWLCVVEKVSEDDAKASEQRKREAAAKYGVDATYLALPNGEKP